MIATPPWNGTGSRERTAAQRRERLVEAIERTPEESRHRDVVTGGGEGGRALRPDQSRPDDDDPPRSRGEHRRDSVILEGSALTRPASMPGIGGAP